MGVVRMSVPFTRPSSWARMRDKSTSDGSCFKALYDSIINAVTTAEKRPAFKQDSASFGTRCRGQTHEDQKVLNLVFPCLTSHFLPLYPRSQQQGERVPFNFGEWVLRRVAYFHRLRLDSLVSIAVLNSA